MTLDMAKQICMIQRTELGKQYREYFIQLEKDYKALQEQIDVSNLTPEMQLFNQMFKAVAKTQQELQTTQKEVKQLQQKADKVQGTVTDIKHAVIFQPDNWRAGFK